MLDADAHRPDRAPDRGLRAGAPADRRRGRRRPLPLGRCDRDPGGLPVPRALAAARRAPGRRRLPQRRHQPGRRAGLAAARRRDPGRRGGRHRRLPGVVVLVCGDVGLLRAAGRPLRAPLRGRRAPAPGAQRASPLAVGPREAGRGADRWAGCDRGPPEHRHHRRQAPVRRAARKLLRGGGGRRQGADLVAMGAGFYLVPEVSRRRAEGLDTRAVLLKSLAIVLVCAVPVLLIYGGASHLLISSVFGAAKAGASDSLIILGLAFAVLACTYLAIQYMLALKRAWFLLGVGAVALAEPALLLNASHRPASFAAVVLGVQVLAALIAFALALRPERGRLEQPELNG